VFVSIFITCLICPYPHSIPILYANSSLTYSVYIIHLILHSVSSFHTRPSCLLPQSLPLLSLFSFHLHLFCLYLNLIFVVSIYFNPVLLHWYYYSIVIVQFFVMFLHPGRDECLLILLSIYMIFIVHSYLYAFIHSFLLTAPIKVISLQENVHKKYEVIFSYQSIG
jgi:hypothetical protein